MGASVYFLAYSVPISAMVGLYLGSGWTFLTPFIFFVLVPVLDELVSRDEVNADDDEETRRLENPLYRGIVLGWLPLQVAAIVLGAISVSLGKCTSLEVAGILLSVGLTGAAGINVAHELMHRTNRFDKAAAELLMASVFYTHFCVEHVFGHHRRVATRQDPATSRFGETVYGFVPRSVLGSFLSFWEIETGLVKRKGFKFGDLRDRRVRYPLGWVAYLGIGWATLGLSGALFLALQGVIAFCMLEVVNYLEHYGLERAELAPGRYRRVMLEDSWSSSHRLTGYILFGLPRHADHHYKASRAYPILRHHSSAPQLPAGYLTMILLALLPPLWFLVMNPRVEAVMNKTAAAQPESAQA